MNKAEQYIKQATTERVRSRGLIRKVATEAAQIQRTETTASAVEAFKQMCPSRSARGCASVIHRTETQSTRCDGNCKRIKYLLNAMERREA